MTSGKHPIVLKLKGNSATEVHRDTRDSRCEQMLGVNRLLRSSEPLSRLLVSPLIMENQMEKKMDN